MANNAMAYSPAMVQAPVTSSMFRGVVGSNYGGPFGTATATKKLVGQRKDKKTGKTKKYYNMETSMSLSPELQSAYTGATNLINSQLPFLTMDPNQRYDYIRGGSDPYYNLLSKNLSDFLGQSEARQRLNAARTGGSNSTTLGAALGTISNEGARRESENILNAFNFGNTTALNNIGAGQGLLGSLSSLLYPLGSGSNANYMTSLNARDNTNQFNAGLDMQARMANAQAQNQALQMGAQMEAQQQGSKGSWLGPALGALGTIGGAFLGGPLGGSIGGKIGSFGGGAIGSSLGGNIARGFV